MADSGVATSSRHLCATHVVRTNCLIWRRIGCRNRLRGLWTAVCHEPHHGLPVFINLHLSTTCFMAWPIISAILKVAITRPTLIAAVVVGVFLMTQGYVRTVVAMKLSIKMPMCFFTSGCSCLASFLFPPRFYFLFSLCIITQRPFYK